MSDTTNTPSGESRKGSDESFSWSESDSGGDTGRGASGREWVSQLQSMIDNLATNAAPVIREIGAKAAELAALAGEKAGPIAHRAADATATAGSKVAERGREVAAELRRDAARNGEGTDGSSGTGSSGTGTSRTGTSGTGASGISSVGARPGDSADSLGE